MKQSVSIIIPTFHRKESLLRLLGSLVKNVDTHIEIIVVEQKESNGNAIKDYAKKRGLKLTHFFLKDRSTPHAMNVGVRKARGKFIIFLDDDVTVHKDFVKYHLADFANTEVAATVGRVITDGQPVEPNRRDTARIDWLGGCSDGFSSSVQQEVDTVIGANTCWRKNVFNELGGFDERFRGNALRFESDFSLRAKGAGYKIMFEPSALVYHHREPVGGARKTEGFFAWYRDYFYNETLFFVKHRPKILLPLFWVTKILWVATNI